MKKIIFLLVLVFTASAIFAGGNTDNLNFEEISEKGSDWPQWRGPNMDGVYPADDWNPKKLNSKAVIWTKDIGVGYSAPAIHEDKVYTIGSKDDKDVVYCLDIITGKELWSFSYEASAGWEYEGTRATPTYDNGKLYTLSRDAMLHCLNAETGKEIWKLDLKKNGTKNPTWAHAGSPLVFGNMLVINAKQYGIALNKNDGSVIWESPKDQPGYASSIPFQFKGKDYFIFFGKTKFYAVEQKTGKILWQQEWKTGYNVNAGDPLIFDNKIFVATGYEKGGALYNFGSGKPKLLWKTKKVISHFHSFIYYKKRIFASSGDAGTSRTTAFRCINPKDGSVVWEENLGFAGFILADDKFIALNEKGKVFIFEASTKKYKLIKDAQFENGLYWTAPVMAYGLLFIRSHQGQLSVINLRK